MKHLLLILLLLLACPVSLQAQESFDVVVYGGTSAGVAAAVQASRMGKSAVLIEPGKHLGGLSSGGLGMTDIGDSTTVGGIAYDFYRRVKLAYAGPEAWLWESRQAFAQQYHLGEKDPAMTLFEPHVAEAVFEQLVRESKLTVVRQQRLDLQGGVGKRQGRIQWIRMESGRQFRGKMFLDCTYEGDLMAHAGVTYTVGREDNRQYHETLDGAEPRRTISHQFFDPIDPYLRPGDPSSGLLPGISPDGPGREGAADRGIQAYNFRLCLTPVKANQVPIDKPAAYDPLRYELLARYLVGHEDWELRALLGISMVPNQKTDANNSGPVSSDFIGQNYDYPEADYAGRQRIWQAHKDYLQGFLWFLQNDPRVPRRLQANARQWGLARDEFRDSDHWPRQLYIREARRMIADYVMTERNCRKLDVAEDSVGLGSYGMDSHNVRRYVDEGGAVRNEGNIEVGSARGYAISYRAIVPKKGQCGNLLVPVCVSATHIAFGSMRMEPVFMILGQSASTAACIAIDEGVAVQDVPYAKLRSRLSDDGQKLWRDKP